MNYIEVRLVPSPFEETYTDILAAELGDLGYDSFCTEEDCLKAYCPKNLFSKEALQKCVDELPMPGVSVKWSASEVETQDWNEQWEKENVLTPIPFGEESIVIRPQMSFGSGHHETTPQLLEEIQGLALKGCSVLDMGTGTGVLAIACAIKGAKVRAIEIDDRVALNAVDNVLLNGMSGQVQVECGDVNLLGNGQTYDLVLANINRNVLLSDMHAYVADMKAEATLLMSGFYEEDVPQIRECAESLGLEYCTYRNRNGWVVIKFRK